MKLYVVDGEGEGGSLNTFNPTHSISEYSDKLETVVDHLIFPLTTEVWNFHRIKFPRCP